MAPTPILTNASPAPTSAYPSPAPITHRQFSGLGNLVSMELLKAWLVRLADGAHANFDERLPRPDVGVSQPSTVGEKLLHRTGDRVVGLGIILVEPLAEIAM